MNELVELRCREGVGIFPQAGKFLAAKCAYCGALLNVERNRNGPRSFVEALAYRTGKLSEASAHDHFTCPNQGTAEHRALVRAVGD